MALSAEWRTNVDQDTVIVVDDSNEVREALLVNPDVLSRFLTDTGEMEMWRGPHAVEGEERSPAAWGELVMARAQSGEVITMDPRLFWDGIYSWFRSRGVDYDTGHR